MQILSAAGYHARKAGLVPNAFFDKADGNGIRAASIDEVPSIYERRTRSGLGTARPRACNALAISICTMLS